MSTGLKGTPEVSEFIHQSPASDIYSSLEKVTDPCPKALFAIKKGSQGGEIQLEILDCLQEYLASLPGAIISKSEISLLKKHCSERPGLSYIATMILLGHDEDEIYSEFLDQMWMYTAYGGASHILFLRRRIPERDEELERTSRNNGHELLTEGSVSDNGS